MKKVFIIAAAAMVTLASCEKQELQPASSVQPMHEIALKTVSGLTKSAINGTSFPAGYDMLVSAYRNLDENIKGDDKAEDYFEGIKFTKTDSSTWHASTPKYWPLTGKLDILALAGAGLKSGDSGIVPTCAWGASGNAAKQVVVTVPDNSAKFDDLLYGAANAQSYVATGTPISFNHAMAAVVFTAKSNVPYDASGNAGITIDSIAVNGAKYSGKLTVSNPAAGGKLGTLSAAWSDWSDEKPYIFARKWDTANSGTSVSEQRLTALNLTATSKTVGTAAPFGEGYVILPAQAAVPFTVYYTIHNGKNASGAVLDNHLQYKYTTSGNWDMAKKYVYDINISLNEILINPSVVDWTAQIPVVDVPIKQ